MIRLKSLLEQINGIFPSDDIIDKYGSGESGYEGIDKTPFKDYKDSIFNVFVSGIETGVPGATQYTRFENAYTGQLPVKWFRYPEVKSNSNEFIDFLRDNVVRKIILFSAGCYLANEAAAIVGPENVYCIEPYSASGPDDRWSQIPSKNFYVHPTDAKRGAMAKVVDGKSDPVMNYTLKGRSHLDALTYAVPKIIM
jgi:hypothetical protein